MNDNQSDYHLLQLIFSGSQKAFDQFYDTYISFVFTIAMQVLGDHKEAEDVCHDIFIEIYQKPNTYKADKGSVKAWLAVKTRSRSIDRLRKRKPILVNKLETLETEQEVKAELHVLSKLEREVILEALKAIPKKQQQVIYGAYFEGKTQVELAESLNRPLGTIKSLVKYGLNNLRKQKTLHNWTKLVGSEKRDGT